MKSEDILDNKNKILDKITHDVIQDICNYPTIDILHVIEYHISKNFDDIDDIILDVINDARLWIRYYENSKCTIPYMINMYLDAILCKKNLIDI